MSTQKKESTAVKGPAKSSTKQDPPKVTTAQKGTGSDARKVDASTSDRSSTKERENDTKRPTATSKKN